MARKRLCYKADKVTRYIMTDICNEIVDRYVQTMPDDAQIWDDVFLPACGCDERNCHEFKPCGAFEVSTDKYIAMRLTDEYRQIKAENGIVVRR